MCYLVATTGGHKSILNRLDRAEVKTVQKKKKEGKYFEQFLQIGLVNDSFNKKKRTN